MIDLIYLEESKRIRKEYLDNLAYIANNEDEISKYVEIISDIQEQIKKSNNTKEEFFKEKLYEINDNITKITKYVEVYRDKIKQLDVDQRVLYNAIKSKYPNILDEELQSDIMKYVESVNTDFINRNEELYKKLNNRK